MLGGAYAIDDEVVGAEIAHCYPSSEGAGLLVSTTAASTVTVLGAPEPLMNEHLDEEGNAALALNLLGADDRLVWYRPTIETAPGDETSFTALLPDWVEPAVWQLGIAAAIAAIWRARRLGRLVPEPLPVVVPASETVYGRARLYRRGPLARATPRGAARGQCRTHRRCSRSAQGRPDRGRCRRRRGAYRPRPGGDARTVGRSRATR